VKTFVNFLFFFCLLISTVVLPHSKAYAMDPKVKVMATTALYGTVGGALLGTASLAFGTKGRAVAIGSSLGLYAGLLFGSYVVVTHQMQQRGYFDQDAPIREDNYYPDSDRATPYQPGFGGGGFFDGLNQRNLELTMLSVESEERRMEYDRMLFERTDRPRLMIQFFHYQF
jgi:hypothetical protein